MPAAVPTDAPTAAHRSVTLTNWSLMTVASMFEPSTQYGVRRTAGSVVAALVGSVVVPFTRPLGAGQPAPSGLVNGTTTDPTNAATTEPAVLLTPYWVDGSNMEATVIADKFVAVADLCAAVGASVGTAAGIK